MNCKYSYYDGEKDSFNMQHLYCNISKQECHAIRRCMTVKQIVSTDGHKNCKLYIEMESNVGVNKDTPNKVLFEKRGKLYIETNDSIGQVIALDNPFDTIPQAVKLIKKQNGEYSIYIKKETSQNEKKRN
jgi:hypothetical protein